MGIITKRTFMGLAACMMGATGLHAQALSGFYTIDPSLPSGGNNYQSFGAATAALDANGVSAPVTFSVAAGTFNEQVLINEVAGASAINTVTFQGNETTISFNSTNSNSRAVVKLNGADHIRLLDLGITATGSTTSEYGYGIQLLSNADSNLVMGCNIYTSESSTSAVMNNFAGIVISQVEGAIVSSTTVLGQGDPGCDYNTFQDNTITGGHYGITLMANGTTSTITGNKILNNTIKNFYRTGIFLNGTTKTLIEGNDISRPNRPGTSFFQFFGMHLDGGNSGLNINRNKIHDPFGANYNLSGSGAFGFYINGSVGDAAAPNVFSNNIIYNMKSNGIAEGADITSSNSNHFIHNTIDINDSISTAFGATRGISITTSSDIVFWNNVIRIRRSGGSGKHCVYLSGTVNAAIDHNDYFLSNFTGGTNTAAYTGYLSGNRSTLTDWTNISGYDQNSISEDPQYVNSANANFLPQNNALQSGYDAATTGITTDFNNQLRNTLSPTLGAVESNVVLAVKMSALKGLLTADNHAQLNWTTYSETDNNGFGIQSSADGKQWSTEAFVASRAADGNSAEAIAYQYNGTKALSAATYFRLEQTDADGTITYSNVVNLSPAAAGSAGAPDVYPNPARGTLTIDWPVNTGANLFSIYDVTGRLQLQQPLTGSHTTLSLNRLPAGAYYYKVTGSGVTYSGKLTLQ